MNRVFRDTDSTPYVGFEGPIGAGKTTLATILAEYTGWELLLEDVQGNEFLADFYTDRPRWALPMQLAFLVTRHEQLVAGVSGSGRAGAMVADHTYAKDAMFARILLTEGREQRLYDRVHSNLSAAARQPDLIVYLDAPNDVLLERIRRRGRQYETTIDHEYLDRLRAAYATDLLSSVNLRILRVETTHLDIDSEQARTEVCERIIAAV